MIRSNDTIAAIATPPGESGIGIVRMSGPEAFSICDKVFVPKNGKKPSQFKSHSIHYGHIARSGTLIDEVLLSTMRAPRTYTREDMAEINCHGGVSAMREVFDLVVSHGARIAEPGEFTKRAFLSGRIDLMQAEAVLDVIRSKTDAALSAAQRQLKGAVSGGIRSIRSRLIDAVSEIEAALNFPEEELDAQTAPQIHSLLKAAREEILRLLSSSEKGMILREGLFAVICGKPNVGKSSLLNRLLGMERAIVTPVPGTTRDMIEEFVNIGGIPLRLADTAGIMDAGDEPTMLGVEKSRLYIESADLIIFVADASCELDKRDIDIIETVKDKKVLIAANKSDLPLKAGLEKIKERIPSADIISVSAKHGTGIEALEKAIHDMIWTEGVAAENIFLSNSRHIEAARRALGRVDAAIRWADEKRPWEFLAIDIRAAADALGEITGEVFSDDLLDSIFSKFCVGK